MADPKSASKDYQKELNDLYESGVTDRQMEAAKARNKADYDELVKQGLELMRPKEDQKNTAPRVYKKGGKTGSASKRADGCAIKGKTKGRFL